MKTQIDPSRLIQLVQGLIRIPTVNPPGLNYHELVNFLNNHLFSIGVETKILDQKPDFPILVGWLNRGAKPELHFNCHYDVVPESGTWSFPPFGGVVSDHKVYGRGAADMKGGIASVVSAIEETLRSKEPLTGCVSFSFVPDEETGGNNGAKLLVDSNLIRPDMVVIPEPSFPRILLGHKGVIQLLVTLKGSSAHAAMPTVGKNAFETMIDVAQKITDHFQIKNGIVQSVLPLYPINAGQFALPTMTLGGTCSSGTAINTVPSKCTFSIDRRFLPIEQCAEVLREIELVVQKVDKDAEITHALIADSSVMNAEEGAELLGDLQSSITAVIGEPAPQTISAGFMDSRFFRTKWNIPAIAYGPGEAGTAHIADEYVSVDKLVQVAKVFRILIQDLVGLRLS